MGMHPLSSQFRDGSYPFDYPRKLDLHSLRHNLPSILLSRREGGSGYSDKECLIFLLRHQLLIMVLPGCIPMQVADERVT